MKFSHLLVGAKVPPHIKDCLEEQPARSGMYNWIFAHKGEINCWQNMTKHDLEKFDQVQVNITPADMMHIPRIRRALKGSSTKLILNNDYVCEYWGKWGEDPYRYDEVQAMGDMVFGTEPHQVSNMLPGTFCMPHPTNTQAVKRLGTIRNADEQNSAAFIYHWWAGETYLPFRTMRMLKKEFGLDKIKVAGYGKGDQMARFHNHMWDEVMPLESFPKYAQRIQGEKYVYDPNPCHTYGRNGVEFACWNKPIVGSDRVFSYNKLFPELTCDPYDHKAVLEKFRFIRDNPDEVKQITDRAYKEVEYFNYKNSVKRWKEACDIAFDRGGHKWYARQVA